VRINISWHIFCFIVALIELIVPILERTDLVSERFWSIEMLYFSAELVKQFCN